MKKICLIMMLICMIMVSCKPDGNDGKSQEHEYVDLGLSVKWATCNVGANSPEDYGQYFAWGETCPKVEYTSDNSVTYEKTMNDIAGNDEYDAVRANWGGEWRMPTKAEMQELIDNCIWTLTARNGVNGYNVEGSNGNSIFLPAAGAFVWSALNYVGSSGFYWCSTPSDGYYVDAYYLYFDSSKRRVHGISRIGGQSVRPVIE